MKKIVNDKRGLGINKVLDYALVILIVAIVIGSLVMAFKDRFGIYLPTIHTTDKRTVLPEISDSLWQESLGKECTLIGWIDSKGGNYIYELYSDGKEFRDVKIKGVVIYHTKDRVVGNNNGVSIQIDQDVIDKYKDKTDKESKFVIDLNNAYVLDNYFLCGSTSGEDLPDEEVITEKPDVKVQEKTMLCEGEGENSFKGTCEWWNCDTGEISKGRVDCFYGYSCCLKVEVVPEANNVESYTTTTNLKSFRKLNKEELDSYFSYKKRSDLSILSDAIIQSAKDNGIDPYYVFSHFVHETGWGTSKIWKEKNNPFGIGAYDKCPFDCALKFDSKEEGIKEGVKWIRDRYLCEKGESTKCKYPSDNLKEMNVKYASDKNWATKITNNMNGLNDYVIENRGVVA